MQTRLSPANRIKAVPNIDHWRSVAHPPALSPGGLHLWKIHTGGKGASLAPLWPLLSRQESERAGKLRFDHHRERYVRAHAGLRRILSGYLGIGPETIGFHSGEAGKPMLARGAAGLEFNLTTSGDLALVALSLGASVGVDCEQVSDRGDVVAIARKMFTPEQVSRITAAAPEDRLRQFHIAWTALEAEVKADGRDLFGHNRPAARGALRIEHCVPEPGFMAAVACERLPPVGEWVTMILEGPESLHQLSAGSCQLARCPLYPVLCTLHRVLGLG